MITVYTDKHTVDFINDRIIDNDTDEYKPLKGINKKVLQCLIEGNGRVITRSIMRDIVYGTDSITDLRTIDKRICDLRKLLGDECHLIVTKGDGYCWKNSNDTDSEYKPFDGLKKCFSYSPDAGYVDLYTQMGQTLFTDKNAKKYFHESIGKGVKFRIIINSPDAVSVGYKNGNPDYLENWHLLSADPLKSGQIDVRISESTFHDRLFLVYSKDKYGNIKDGIADIRNYHYSTNLSQAKTQVVSSTQKKTYNFYVKEFENLWNKAIPVNEYIETEKIKESAEQRMIQAYEAKEKGNIGTFINLLQNLSDEGYGVASNRLGICYITGKYVKPDAEKGVGLLSTAAEKNIPESLLNLGICSWFGLAGLPQNYKTAVSYFRTLTKLQADGDAYFYLYLAYRDGHGVTANAEKAAGFRQQAESLGITSQNTYEFNAKLQTENIQTKNK